MKAIAIHQRADSFSKDWIDYCQKNGIPYKIVNCYDSEIVDQLKDTDGLLWHYHHASYKDHIFAKQLLFALERSKLAIFPDFHTSWHFDDKVGQRYLLEAIGAPTVPTLIFYDKRKALKWAEQAEFPKIFKLRNGASSENVELVKNSRQAQKLIHHAFGKGFSQYAPKSKFRERFRKFRNGDAGLWNLVKGLLRFGYTTDFDRMAGKERGYVYFQDYIPGKSYDIRVVVVGDKAFGMKRIVRKNDFRASGSGRKFIDRNVIRTDVIQLAFEIAERLKSQCVAFDIIYDEEKPKILEISYGFTTREIHGYWDKSLNWHDEPARPAYWMIENLLKSVAT